MDRYFVAADLGAGSGRVLAGAFDGASVSLQEMWRFPNRPIRVNGHLHWDVLRLFDEMQTGLGRAGHQCGRITSVGVDTWGVDFGLLDRTGALIGNPYHYRDPRTDGVMERVFQVASPDEIFERTGCQFAQLNTLYQLYSMVDSPALEQAATLLMMPDLFNYWLTGVKAAEFSVATTTQFCDPARLSWTTDLLARLGLPTAILPPIMPSGVTLGPLLPEWAELPGLSDACVVAPACHDTASAVAAIPAVSPNFAYISSGTWSLMGVVSPTPVINATARRFNFGNEGGVDGTMRVLKNITGLWLLQECRRAWAGQDENLSYDDIMALASAAPPLRSLVNPDADAFVHPADMPAAICAYCAATGQPAPSDRGAIVRAALEGLALKYRMTVEELEILSGRRLDVIHVVGGGAQNALLCQLAADACNRPVYAGPVEATALGNMLAQLIATGECASWAEAREIARASIEMREYTPQANSDWDAAFERFLRLPLHPQA